ncbi:MAG: PAS domain S-box protein [Halodesulfurarchaeum sp.]
MSRPRRVLQVQPSDGDADLLPDSGAGEGRFDVETVTTPEAALGRLSEDTFDCVFTYDRLADGDGLEVLSRVREQDSFVPVVLYATDGSEQMAAKAVSAGVNEYVPAGTVESESELNARIAEVLERARSRRTLAAEREVFVQGPAVIFKWRDEPDWPILSVSENVEDVLGYTARELETNSMTYADLVHDRDLTHLREEARKYTNGELDRLGHDPYRVETKDGRIRWVLEHTRTIEDPALGTEVLFGYVIDITKRRQRELELQQFREAVEQTGHVVYITDPQGTIEYVNPAFESVTGYERDDALGETPQLLLPGTSDGDGSQDFWTSIQSKDTIETEVINERTDGKELVVWQTISPILDEHGDIRKYVTVAQDVTELKEYEGQLERQRDNLEVLNQVVRHDIRNELQLVQAYVESALTAEEQRAETLETALMAARDAVEITETARDVTEVLLQPTAELVPKALRPVISDRLADIETRYDHVEVTVDGTIPAVEVLADDMLGAVFRNLLSNAVQHNDTDRPEILVSATRDGDHAIVTITDNGPGIPEAHREEIFGKGATGLDSEGTGLGLYLVETLLDRYGGSVTIEDRDSAGARFVVRLQLAT